MIVELLDITDESCTIQLGFFSSVQKANEVIDAAIDKETGEPPHYVYHDFDEVVLMLRQSPTNQILRESTLGTFRKWVRNFDESTDSDVWTEVVEVMSDK
jgi:hypothetical protein